MHEITYLRIILYLISYDPDPLFKALDFFEIIDLFFQFI